MNLFTRMVGSPVFVMKQSPSTPIQSPMSSCLKMAKCRFANFLGVNKDLQAAGKVGKIEKLAFSHVAMRGDSPGGAHRADPR